MDPRCGCDNCELKTAFFKSFRKEELGIFCDQKEEIKYRRGEMVFSEGDEIRYFSYLKSGLVKLFRTDTDGRDQIITIAGPFDFVSLLGVFSETHQTYSVSVLEDSVVCCIDIRQMKAIAQENGLFVMNLMERLGAISNKIILESLEIRKRHTHGKVAYILMKFCCDIYHSHVFELPVSRREIAEYIGLTTENVIRALSEFRREKLLRINGREIEILDVEALRRISSYG